MKRGGKLSPSSKSRIDELAGRRAIREQVFERDGGCVMRDGRWGKCFGEPTFHHLLKASQGGKYTVENGICLCVGHNCKVEDEPAAAYALGLVVKSWEVRDDIASGNVWPEDGDPIIERTAKAARELGLMPRPMGFPLNRWL